MSQFKDVAQVYFSTYGVGFAIHCGVFFAWIAHVVCVQAVIGSDMTVLITITFRIFTAPERFTRAPDCLVFAA